MTEENETKGKGSIRKIIVIAVHALVVVAAIVAFFYYQHTQVVVTVNGERITRNQLYTAMSEMQDNQGNTVEDLAIDDIVTRLVVEGKAKELGLEATDEEIDAEIQEIVDKNYDGDMDWFLQELEMFGVDIEDIKKDITISVLAEKIAEDDDIEVPDEVEVRHILVETEEEAMNMLAELDNGRDFAELAEEYSVCPSGDRGGNLGFFGPGRMRAEFEDASYAAEVGEIVGPVETDDGFHIIEVMDRREGVHDIPQIIAQLKEEADINYR